MSVNVAIVSSDTSLFLTGILDPAFYLVFLYVIFDIAATFLVPNLLMHLFGLTGHWY